MVGPNGVELRLEDRLHRSYAGDRGIALDALRAGDVAVIAAVRAAEPVAKRLADMGFVRGTQVQMLRPGAPCIVRIGNSCFGVGQGLQVGIQLMGT